MNTVNQFMVDFTVSEAISTDFIERIPSQKEVLQRLFNQGILCSFASAVENAKMWAIFNANSEYEVMRILATLPLANYMNYQISMLSTYNTVDAFLPQFSKN